MPVKAVTRDRASSESAHALRDWHTDLAAAAVHRADGTRTAGDLRCDRRGASNQYVIGYVPATPAADGTFRRISVGVLEPRAGTARTRAGYAAGGARAGDNLSALAATVGR